MKYLSSIIAAAFALTAAAQDSHAFATFSNWGSASQNMRASQVSFPVGNAYRTSLSTAFSRWNSNPSTFNWTAIWDDPGVSTGNTQNEIWFATGVAADPPAETLTTSMFGQLVTADVIFYTNSGTTWTTSMTCSNLLAYGGANRPFEPAALHELGHAMGLDHEDDEYNVMGREYTHIHRNGDACRSYPGEDASDGAVALYGLDGAAGQDVSVSHWAYSGSSGGYSTHSLTKIYAAGSAVAKSSVGLSDGQRRYNVLPGETVDVEFTFENNGRSTQSPRVGFYLSTNSTMSTGDTFITSTNPTLSRGDVYTRSYSITIPVGTAPGNYWLGAIVDYGGVIAEFDESNNSSSIQVDVN